MQMKEMPPAFFVDMDSDDEDMLTDEQKRVRDMERAIYASSEYFSSRSEFKGAEKAPVRGEGGEEGGG